MSFSRSIPDPSEHWASTSLASLSAAKNELPIPTYWAPGRETLQQFFLPTSSDLLVLENHRSPGETCAKAHQKQFIASFDSPIFCGFCPGDGNRSCRRIAVFIQIHHYLFTFYPHEVHSCVDDSGIGLMGNEPIYISNFQAGFFSAFLLVRGTVLTAKRKTSEPTM